MKRYLITLRRAGMLAAAVTIFWVSPLLAVEQIADYTSFPPFLPRVVSPSILFMLDFSSNMVRPAYGECNSAYQDCRYKFFMPNDDYSTAIDYFGYFRENRKYSCPAGLGTNDLCAINSSGTFNSNWLNWLATTQFDVMKKVSIGGDFTSAPETGNPTTLYSELINASIPNTASTAVKSHAVPVQDVVPTYKEFYKVVKKETCESNAPAALCDASVPQAIPYKWIDTPTTLAASDYAWYSEYTGDVSAKNFELPFEVRYFEQAFSRITISDNGFVLLKKSGDTSVPANDGYQFNNTDLPYSHANYANMINVFWDDLSLAPNTGSYVARFTVGTAPNRIYVVTWNNVYPYYYPQSNPTLCNDANGMTFQMLIFESPAGKESQVVLQYKDVVGPATYGFDGGVSATVGIQDETAGTRRIKKYAWLGKKAPADTTNTALLTDKLALHLTYGHSVFRIDPQNNTNGLTNFRPAGFGDSDGKAYHVRIDVKVGTSYDQTTTSFMNGESKKYYDHEVDGLIQELRDAEQSGLLGFRIAVMKLNSANGGQVVKPFNDNSSWTSTIVALRNHDTTGDAPLAEALHIAEGYFRQDTTYALGLSATNSWTNSGIYATCDKNDTDPFCYASAGKKVACAKGYVLMVSSGSYSHDFGANIYDATTVADVSPLDAAWRLTDGEVDAGRRRSRNFGGMLDNIAYQLHAPNLTPADLRQPNEGASVDIPGNQTVATYVVNTFGAGSGDGTAVLKRSAMYGGFKDADGNNALTTEDTNGNCVLDAGEDVNNNGVLDSEDNCNDPYTYYSASGGGDLRAQIMNAVTDILKNSASGTSVSVLSTSAGGEGALYQAYFYPAKVDTLTQKEDTRWPGYLRAFLLDRYQNLRDDYSGNGISDGRLVLAQDRVTQMYLDPNTNEVMVNLFNDSDGNGTVTGTSGSDYAGSVKMDSVVSLWEGGEKLALRDKKDSAKRKIFLWLDENNDGVVNDGVLNISDSDSSGETRPVSGWSGSELWRYLRAGDTLGGAPFRTATQEAEKILDYVSGEDVPGFRNRCIYVPSASENEAGCSSPVAGKYKRVWPLGDIIFSTPTLVSSPGEKYDAIYGEASYKPFTNLYKNRRNVVYVGANDGLLHAFNAGVYKQGDDSSTAALEQGRFIANPESGSGYSDPTPAVGDELWAFIPYDNLPHLAWLACNGTGPNPLDSSDEVYDPTACFEAEYTHVYYADQRPKVSDMRIFNDAGDVSKGYDAVTGKVDGQPDTVHPNGWGTVMLVPLRLGGGAIDVDINGDGIKERRFQSAIYAFDITNPEKPPKLLWRFKHANLGFTTTYPVIAHTKSNTSLPLSVSNEKWYMVVGSGPANLPPGVGDRDYGFKATSQNGYVFVVNMQTGQLETASPIDTGVGNSIMGDATSVDVDIDFVTDTIYIGSANIYTYTSAGETKKVMSGRIHRINTNGGPASGWVRTLLFDPDTTRNNATVETDISLKEIGPLFVGPSVSKDASGNLWVFFGTGRLKDQDDINNSDLQRYYGIKDGCWQSSGASGAGPCLPTSTSPVTYTTGNLLNSSGVLITDQTGATNQVVATNEACDPTSANPTAAATCDYNKLLTTARSKYGWFVNLADPVSGPSERVLARGSVLGGLVLFTTYQPANDICSILGNSRLYALYYETGTAFNKPIFKGTEATSTSGDEGRTGTGTTEYINRSTSLGLGMPTSVGVAIGETVSGFVQKSTGEIIRIETAPGLNVRSGASSWRETTNPSGGAGIETIYKHIVK